MQQTANYQLNQWDGEDRIMRSISTATTQKLMPHWRKMPPHFPKPLLPWKPPWRPNGRPGLPVIPPPIRQPLPPGRNCSTPLLPSNPPALPAMPLSAENLPLRTASIRKGFAAADAAISSACPIVKLQSIVTSQAATQVDLDMRDSSYRNMAFLILIPQVITSAERVYLRVNSLGRTDIMSTKSTGHIWPFPLLQSLQRSRKLHILPVGIICHGHRLFLQLCWL